MSEDGQGVPAVCSVMGGQGAQDVIRGITGHGCPIDSFMVFDGVNIIGHILK